jgi:HlyD family secretion protein
MTEKLTLKSLLLPVGAALLLGGAAGCHPKPAADAAAPADAAKPDAKTDPADAAKADAGADSLPAVETVTAQSGAIEKTLPVTGTLMARRDQEASISAPVAGVIDALPIRFGETVVRGQLLFHLSTRTLQGQIDQARATIAQNSLQVQQARTNALLQQGQGRSAVLQAQSAVSGARATLLSAQATLTGDDAALENARQSLARQENLFTQGLVAQKDVEAAKLAVRAAQAVVAAQGQTIAAQAQTVKGQEQALQGSRVATIQNTVKNQDIAIARQQVANAEGALATAKAQEALYTVRAPLSGTITSVGASLGETVDATVKVATLANLDTLQLQIAVPSASASQVRVGLPVSFTVDAVPGRTFRATIRTVGAQIDATNSTVSAVAAVENRGHLLKDDMPARVSIVTGRHHGSVIVPKSAVFQDAGGASASVMEIDKGDVVHKISVTVGLTEGDRVEIRSGVRPGDLLATVGGYGLPDGTKVQVSGADGKAAK